MTHDTKPGMNHMWLMALACAIPLVAVIALPLLGVTANITWIALGLMVVLHLWMMKGHSKGGGAHH